MGAPDNGALRISEAALEENAAALRNTIQRLLELFNIEPSVISDALNFAAQSPDDAARLLQDVVRYSVEALPPEFRLRLEAYRRDPTVLAVRWRVGLALLAEAILEAEATSEECVTALRDLGLLPNEGGEVVERIANQVHYVEKSIVRIVPKRGLFSV